MVLRNGSERVHGCGTRVLRHFGRERDTLLPTITCTVKPVWNSAKDITRRRRYRPSPPSVDISISHGCRCRRCCCCCSRIADPRLGKHCRLHAQCPISDSREKMKTFGVLSIGCMNTPTYQSGRPRRRLSEWVSERVTGRISIDASSCVIHTRRTRAPVDSSAVKDMSVRDAPLCPRRRLLILLVWLRPTGTCLCPTESRASYHRCDGFARISSAEDDRFVSETGRWQASACSSV